MYVCDSNYTFHVYFLALRYLYIKCNANYFVSCKNEHYTGCIRYLDNDVAAMNNLITEQLELWAEFFLNFLNL